MTIQDLLKQGIEERQFPGAAACVNGEFSVAGRFTYDPLSPEVGLDSLWDVASLTKVVATTTLTMMAWERGLLDLDAPAQRYWPSFRHPGVTIRQLLLHRSGLPPYLELWRDCRTPEEAEAKLLAAEIRHSVPVRTVYSCTGFLVMRKVLENVFDQSFGQAFHHMVAKPLGAGMSFNPLDSANCIPTAVPPAWRESEQTHLQGSVHDPAAFILGGVSGNAGIFASIRDLARWSEALVSGEIVSKETVAKFTRRHDAWTTRALGFDTKVPGARGWSAASFGHTGYTGTTIWIDPQAGRTAILLTNRVHPDDSVDLKPFRVKFHEAASRL